MIVSANSYWRSNLAFAAILLHAAMAVALFSLVQLGERLVCPWYTAVGAATGLDEALEFVPAAGWRV